MNDKTLKNQVAIVTGSGCGIGKKIALKLFDKGAFVVINDKNENLINSFKDEVGENKNFLFSCGDITSEEYRQKLIGETLKKFGRIDILVNNAGIGSGKIFLEMNHKDMERSIGTNLIAPFFLSQKAAKTMIKGKIKGTIIFISSVHGKIPSGNADYSSTKSAIIMLVKELAYDLGKYGIRVNGISPGRITEEKTIDQRIPLNSLTGSPEDIADTVAFLSNITLSGYITGETITVDGGLSLNFER